MCELIAAAGLPGPGGSGPGPAGGADDSLIADLRRAVRWVVMSPQDPPGATGPGADWPELASFGVFGLAVPEAAGGLGLGLDAQLAVAGELGEAGYDGGLLDTLAAIDVLAAGPERAGPERYLDRLLSGQCAAALAWAQRPSRPVTDPGPGGLLLVAAGDWPACDYRLLAAGAGLASPGFAARELKLSGNGRAMSAVAVSGPELNAAIATCQGEAAEVVLAADLARRAAWLLGSGWACLVAAVRRAMARQQFGRALIDNQSVAFRLARLAAHAAAIGALVGDLGAAAVSGVALPLTAAAGASGRGGTVRIRCGSRKHAAARSFRHGKGLASGAPLPSDPGHDRAVPAAVAARSPGRRGGAVRVRRFYRPAKPGSGGTVGLQAASSTGSPIATTTLRSPV